LLAAASEVTRSGRTIIGGGRLKQPPFRDTVPPLV
jgi:hypothetical protein